MNYPHLFSPIKIGGITLKNRIEVAPMGSEPNTSPFLSEQNLAGYEIRAKGGAAIVTRGETLVGHKTGNAHGNLCNLDDEGYMSTHLQLTDVIHQHNAIANIEILHCGARAHPKYTNGIIYGPSAQAGVYGVDVIEMNEDIMNEIADQFAHGAFVSKLGGFDMVMIHGGHGWLISQFLSPIYNTRKDKYGGSIENRARFPLMIIERIRKTVGKDFPIEFRMSGHEFIDGGYGLEEAIEFAKIIDEKVDLIHVSAMSFKDVSSGCRMFPSAFLPHNVNAYLAKEIKKHVKTPIATVGAISNPDEMEAMIANGEADIIAMGRQILADPYFPKKVRAGKKDEVRPCIRCNHCLSLDYVPYVPICKGISQCTVNPIVGREFREGLYKAPPMPKKVLVIGGGVGGMQAAITASEQGHDVTLCERSDSLGGMTRKIATDVPFKADLRRYVDYLIRMVGKQNIKVNLNTIVTKELAKSFSADTIICAIGAKPIVPSISGINNDNVIIVTELSEKHHKIGGNIVIVGGGIAGCEEGLNLAMQGKNVTIIEMQEKFAADTPVLHYKAMLLEYAKYPDTLRILTQTKCQKITPNGVVVTDKAGTEKEILADTVIVAVGMSALTDEASALRAYAEDFITVGDCIKPGKVLEAVHGGYFAGKNA